MDSDDIGVLGVLFIFLKLCGIAALLILPLWVIYKFVKWLFD